jgi:hypothetical protein
MNGLMKKYLRLSHPPIDDDRDFVYTPLMPQGDIA